jgi:hypothetical protein
MRPESSPKLVFYGVQKPPPSPVGFTFTRMKKGIQKIIFFSAIAFLYSGCGPDLNPTLYDVKSVLYTNFEEYSFSYLGDKPQRVEGTDTTSIDYTHYTDSVAIRFQKKDKVDHYITLFPNSVSPTKIKTRWKVSQRWYKDSVLFTYNSGLLSSITHKGLAYQTTIENGNLTSIKRGLTNFGVNYVFTYDKIKNPLQSTYWKDEVISISGFSTNLSPLSMARYFSKNNLTVSESNILGAKETQRFTYDYLHGILPKAINFEIENSRSKVSNLIYIGEILYKPKNSNTTP